MPENEINAHPFNTQYLEIFGQWPWKNPQGENQSERFIISSKKISDSRLQSKYNLSQPMQITQQAASFSVHKLPRFLSFLLEKCARNLSKYHP